MAGDRLSSVLLRLHKTLCWCKITQTHATQSRNITQNWRNILIKRNEHLQDDTRESERLCKRQNIQKQTEGMGGRWGSCLSFNFLSVFVLSCFRFCYISTLIVLVEQDGQGKTEVRPHWSVREFRLSQRRWNSKFFLTIVVRICGGTSTFGVNRGVIWHMLIVQKRNIHQFFSFPMETFSW